MSAREGRVTAFIDSIRFPLPAALAIVIAAVIVLSCLELVRSLAGEPIDVTWVYYANTTIVYGLWVGSILFYGFFGLATRRHHPPAPPRTRFLCLIPAYNEAAVIGNSVTSLLRQDYPRSLVDVVVVFDGTDSTDQRARSLGAGVLKTPSPGSGKHNALAYAFSQLLTDDDDRFVCVLDADNVASENFLRQMNNAIVSGGYRCVQGFHAVLNPQVNWVTKALWCATQASSRLYNLGRYRSVGNALVCGTGWCCQAELLRRYWGDICTQTEDIELNGRLLLGEGVRVAWVNEARFYDEKPSRLWIAVRQRHRWMIGHMRCFGCLAWPCLQAGIRRRDVALLEIAAYYAVPFAISLSIVQLVVLVTGIQIGAFTAGGPLASPLSHLVLNAVTLGYVLVYQAVGFGLETGRWGRGILYALYAAVFSVIVWTIALVWSWFSLSRTDWVSHTPHVAGRYVPAVGEARRS